MKRVALLVLPLLAVPLVLRAAPIDKGVTTLRKGPYRFEIATTVRNGDWFGWWGAANDFPGPSATIASVRVYRGKNRLSVPVSAFAGLADPHEYALRQTSAGMELRIVGSDAGEGWRGTFLFNGPGIVSRIVRSGEFPDLDYERTTYRYPRDGEID